VECGRQSATAFCSDLGGVLEQAEVDTVALALQLATPNNRRIKNRANLISLQVAT
jgi:hypothetical protein